MHNIQWKFCYADLPYHKEKHANAGVFIGKWWLLYKLCVCSMWVPACVLSQVSSRTWSRLLPGGVTSKSSIRGSGEWTLLYFISAPSLSSSTHSHWSATRALSCAVLERVQQWFIIRQNIQSRCITANGFASGVPCKCVESTPPITQCVSSHLVIICESKQRLVFILPDHLHNVSFGTTLSSSLIVLPAASVVRYSQQFTLNKADAEQQKWANKLGGRLNNRGLVFSVQSCVCVSNRGSASVCVHVGSKHMKQKRLSSVHRHQTAAVVGI